MLKWPLASFPYVQIKEERGGLLLRLEGMRGCLCVCGCVGMPSSSDVMLSACPVTWDRTRDKDENAESNREMLERLAAETPACFCEYSSWITYVSIYLWITQ